MIGVVDTAIGIRGGWGSRTFLLALTLLLTILGHALVPIGSPLARTTGSAFSASTADVSLGAARREARVAAAQALEPPIPAPAPVAPIAAGAPSPWTVEADRSDRPAGSQPFDARGPPTAAL